MSSEQGSADKGQQGSADKGQRGAQQQGARPSGEQSAPDIRQRAHGAADESGAGLEQIREILFGSVQHELERRLVRTDGQLAARSHELEQEARRRIDVLEAHFRKETEAITARLERGLTETGEAQRKAAKEHQDAIAALEQRVAKVEEAAAHSQRELRRQLLEQAKSFLDELQHLRRELLATLQQELGVAEREMAEELREAEERAGH